VAIMNKNRLSAYLRTVSEELGPSARTMRSMDDLEPEELLADNPTRLEHMKGVGRRAASLARQLQLPDYEAGLLRRAAFMHDIGYASGLKRTGFHQLDGALALADAGAPEGITASALLHSSAQHGLSGRIGEIYAQAPDTNGYSRLVDLVSWCDIRTSATGHGCSLGERVLDIAKRFGPDHIVTTTSYALKGGSLALCRRISAQSELAASARPVMYVDDHLVYGEAGVMIFEHMERLQDNGFRVRVVDGPNALSDLNVNSLLLAGNGSMLPAAANVGLSVAIENGSKPPAGYDMTMTLNELAALLHRFEKFDGSGSAWQHCFPDGE